MSSGSTYALSCYPDLLILAPRRPSISSYPSSISLKFQSLKLDILLPWGLCTGSHSPFIFFLLYLNLNLITQVSDIGSLPQGSPLDHCKKVKSFYDTPPPPAQYFS